jgi:hypothetical protein
MIEAAIAGSSVIRFRLARQRTRSGEEVPRPLTRYDAKALNERPLLTFAITRRRLKGFGEIADEQLNFVSGGPELRRRGRIAT